MSSRLAAAPQAAPAASAPVARAARRRLRHRSLRLSRLLVWLLSGWVGGFGLAHAQVAPGTLPSGGQVVVGSGQLLQSPNLLVIQQNSARLGMDWQSFNIGSSAMVEFRQPGSDSVALNRVLGNSGSEIYGRLKANGQVFLTNPNGVLFAPGAKVDVGGLVASALDLSQQDFAQGRYSFGGAGSGAVVNQGQLRADAGGYLALLGNKVANEGELTVNAGQVVLASGRAATVSISGSGLISAVITPNTLAGNVLNSGRISADGGVVTLTAQSAQDIAASLVNNSGVIRANTLVERSGEIWITGDKVATSGQLLAAAPAGGDAGRIMVIGDMQRGDLQVGGSLDASAAGGGQGGFIETSAAHVKVQEGVRVSTAAGAKTGTWLIDPVDFTIAASGGDMTGASLSGLLGANNITILSNDGATGTLGNVNVNDVVSWSANRLTLNAQNNILINSALNGSGTASLALEYGQGAVAASNSSSYQVNAPVSLPQGNNFSTRLGSNGATTTYTVITSLSALQAIDGTATVLAGNYALGADIDASSTSANGFNPIGNETTYTAAAGQAFTGRFDGLGHSITALTINLAASNYTGLFASAQNASIANVTLVGGSVTGSQYVGGFVGYADGNTTLSNLRSGAAVAAVDNSSSGVTAGGLVGVVNGTANTTGGVRGGVATGAVSADTNTGLAIVGGAVGLQNAGYLSNTSASGNVTATVRSSGNNNYDTGGLVGQFIGASLSGANASGAVSGGADSGGLVGFYNSAGNITGATATGTVSGSVNVGGLFGQALGAGSIGTSSASGQVTGTAATGSVGGLIGHATVTGGLSNVTATGNVSGGNLTGGLVGNYASVGSIANARAEGTVAGAVTVGGLIGYAAGTGGSLSDATALGAVTATATTGYVGGLVGRFAMTGGLVRGEAAGNVSGGNSTGGLVGWYNTTAALSDSLARGTTVTGTAYVGGLVGYGEGLSISGSRASANVTATGDAGGLVGRSAGSITGVNGITTATGNVSGGDDVGGLVGESTGTGNFTTVSASGNVVGTGTSTASYVGGLVGEFANTGASNVQGVRATGNVTGVSTVGGLIGWAGGAGSLSNGTATGTVTASSASYYVGGLVGQFAMTGGMSSARAEGNVSGGAYTGGLVGYYSSTGALSNGVSVATTVTGGSAVGGLVGYSAATAISGSTAVANVTSAGDAGGLVGRSGGSITGVNGTPTATGNVTGNGNVGGVVGDAAGTGALTDLSAQGSVTGTASNSGNVGGMVGFAHSGNVLRGTASGTVSGGNLAGGLIGNLERDNVTIQDSHATGNVTGGTNVGGLVGRAVSTGGSMSGSSATGNVVATTNSGSVGGLAGVFTMSGGMSSTTAEGNVTGGSQTGGLVGYYAVTAPLVSGTANGSTVTGGTSNAGGLVGYSSASAISGSTARADVIGSGNAGGLVGYSSGSITGVDGISTATGDVTGAANVGGLVGEAVGSGSFNTVRASGNVISNSASGGYYTGGLVGVFSGSGSASIQNAHATGNVNGPHTVGGLVGYANGNGGISNSTASGNVTASGVSYYVGGLVGYYSMAGNLVGVTTATTATGNVSGGNFTGGLVGYLNQGGISTTSASGSVAGSTYTGGLVGYFGGGGSLAYGTASGAVTGGSYTGGLVGQFTGAGNLSYSTATGNVTGTAHVGGLVGDFYSGGNITNSTAAGRVTGSTYAGGLLGAWQYSGNITDSRATGQVDSDAYAGGLIGYGYGNGNIDNSSAAGQVTGSSFVGGLVGDLQQSNVSRGGATGNVLAVNNSTAYAGGLIGRFSNSETGGQVSSSTASGSVFADGSGTRAGGLVGDLSDGSIVSSSATGRVTATDSASSTSTEHYAGGLVGNFSGSGSVSGTVSNRSTASGNVFGRSYAGGLVGNYNSTTRMSFVSASGDVTGTQYVGGLAGQLLYAGVDNGVASGRVTASGSGAYAGGLVGIAQPYYPNSVISNSSASGDVSGGQASGGLVGYLQEYYYQTTSNSGIVNSKASGNVSGSVYAGGLVGYYNTANYSSSNTESGIRSSQASGNVQGGQYVGGLVGQFAGYAGIQDSAATGDVTAISGSSTRYLGGLVGLFQNGNPVPNTGGLVRSYASGDVTLPGTVTLTSSTDVYVGGLVGYLDGYATTSVTLSDAYATGAVNVANTLGRLRVGGLVGYTDTGMARTYATGGVTATGGSSRVVGGLVAQRANTSATATNSFWATDTTGQATSIIGTARTLAQLQDSTTFAGWDVATAGGSTSVWRMYQGQTAPLLRGFLTPLTAALVDVSHAYDGTTSLAGAVLAGAANPERIFVAGVAADAGSYAITPGNVYSVQNGYDLTLTGGGTLTIGQRQLTLAGLVANKVYDGGLTATLNSAAQPGNLVAGEDLVFQPGSGFALQFADKSAGVGKTVNFAGSYGFGDGVHGKASNYILPTATNTTADITPAVLTAGSFTATSRGYDGTTAVAVSATTATLSGVIGSDSVSVDLSAVTSGTVANKNVGTGKAVSVLGAAITGADAGNYTLAGIGTVLVDITPKAATANGITAANRQYNATTNVSLNASAAFLSGLVSGDLVEARTNSLTGRVADKNVGDAKPVTITGLGLRGPDAGNYTVQAGSVTTNITPYQLTVYLGRTNQTDRIYDGTTTAAVNFPVYWYSGDDIVVNTTSIGYDSKHVAYDGSGNVTSKTITASGLTLGGTDAGNYTLMNANAVATTSGTISPKALAVTGITASNRVYDGTRDVSVSVASATVNTAAIVSGDNVSVLIPTSGTVTGQVATKHVGTGKAVTVPGLTISGSDAGNYTLNNSSNGVTVNITQKPLTATFTSIDKVYDGDVTARLVTSSADIVSGDAVIFYSAYYYGTGLYYYARYADKNVGSAKTVNVTYEALIGTDAANYNFVNATTANSNNGIYGTTTSGITAKPVTLAFSGVTKVYDGSTAATVTLNYGGTAGVVSGDTLTTTQTAVYTGTGAKNVGTNKPISVSGIVLGGLDAGNYVVANTTANAVGRVDAKPVTLSGINAVDRAYDGTTAVAVTTGTVTSSGFVVGDTVAVTQPPSGLTSGTITNRNVGTNKPVTVTGLGLSGADAGNYTIDVVGSGITVDISQKVLTPAYLSFTKVYNGDAVATVTPDLAAIYSVDTVNFSQQAVFTGSGGKNVGIGKDISVTGITITGGSGSANYTLGSTTASTTGTITAKPVTVQYVGLSRVYTGVANTSASVRGESLQLLQGDAVGFSQSASFTGDGSAGIGKAVAVSNITLTGADAANYALTNTTANTSADITRRPLGVTGITASNRVYDGSTTVAVNVTGATVDTSAVVPGDVVSVSLPPSGISTGTVVDRHVGNGKLVDITGLDITGSSSSNYQLVGATGLTVNITPKALTASYTGVGKVYDGSATAQVNATPADLYAIDAGLVLITAQGTFTAGKNVGTGKDVAVNGGFLTGAGRDDYVLANPTGSTFADISKRTLTAGYTAGLSKVYDGSTSAPANGLLFNLVSGDSVSLSQTATFNDRSANTNKAITITNLALGGNDAGNYELGTTGANTTGTITKKPITVGGLNNVVATDRTYNGSVVVTVTVPENVTLVPQSSDIVSGDQVTIAVPSSGVTSGSVANKNVGNGKQVNVDGLSLGGTDGGNYSIAGTAGITVNITPKALTAAYQGVNRVYDGTVAVTVNGTSGDIVDGDSVFIRGSGVFTGSGARNVGEGKAVSVQTATLSSTDAGNYTLTNTSGNTSADVIVRPVNVSYVGGSRVYDGGTSAPVTGQGAGLIAGDAVSLSQSAVFTGSGAKNVGSGKGISISGIQLQGDDRNNYVLVNTTAATTGSITPKALRIEGLTGVTAADRTYDGTRNVAVTVTSTGTLLPNPEDLIAGDVVGVVAPPSGNTTGTVADKNAGSNKAVTVTGLTLSGADGGNYSIAATSGITVNIARKDLTASYAGITKVYDGLASASVSGSSTDIVFGDTVTIAGSGSYTGTGAKNVGNGKQIAVISAGLSSADAANYTLLNPTGSATGNITPKTVSAAYVGGSKVYDGLVAAPVTGSASGFIAGDDVVLSASAVFTGNRAKDVGEAKTVAVTGISLGGADQGNYLLTSTTSATTASITPKALRIEGLTGVTATDRVYDGTVNVAVTVTTSGPISPNNGDLVPGDDVGVTAPSSGNTTGTVLSKNVGTNKAVAVPGLVLTGADAGNYSVAATSGVTVNITPKSLTAVYTGINRVYDGSTMAGISTLSGDVVGGDNVGILANAVFVGSGARNVGTGKLIEVTGGTLTNGDAGNYTLANPTGSTSANVTPKPISASYVGGTRVYDGTTAAPVSGGANGLIVGDQVDLAASAQFTGTGAKNVGNGKTVEVSGITLSGSDAGNYVLLASSTSTTASITPRPLTVTGISGLGAVDRAYDGTTAVAITGSGNAVAAGGDVIPGDNVSVIVPGDGINAGNMVDKAVGTAKAVALVGLSLGGVDAGNYLITGTAGITVNITPKLLTASYTGLNKVYDGSTAATLSGSAGGIVAGDDLAILGSGVFASKNAGSGVAISVTGGTLSGLDAGNYSLLNPSGSSSADITRKDLGVSYIGGSRVYDGTAAAPVSGSFSGLVDGDSLALTQTAVFTGSGAKNVGSGKTVEVSGITLTGADAANYSLLAASTSTTASITPRALTVTGITGLSAVDRVYDGTRNVAIIGSGSTVAAGGNVVAGDDVTVNLPSNGLNSGTMADKAAGTGKAVVVSGLTLGGTDAANYEITGTAGLTVNIAPRPVVLLGVSAVDRVYDGSTAVAINSLGGSLAGVLAGDDLSLQSSGVSGTMADKHAGSGKAVSVSGLALAGADAGNYVTSNDSLSVNIAQRTLATTLTATDKVYDGSTSATATLADNRVAGDAIVLAHSGASFVGKDVGTGKAVTLGGLTLSGADAGDYVLTSSSASTTASITPKAASVSANSLSKVYGESVNLTGTEFSTLGLVAGESIGLVTLTSAGAAAAAPVVANSYLINVSGAQGNGAFNPSNYTLTYNSAALTVTPRPLTVATNSVVRFADEPNPTTYGFSTNVGGLVLGASISSVVQAAPAGSANAPGGSVFELLPSGAVFASGDAGNYSLRYASGLLIVLPKPPRVGEVETGGGSGGGAVVFAIQVDQAELERALGELERLGTPPAPGTPGTQRFAQLPTNSVPPTAEDISVALSGDSQRITLPALLKLPLISFDPALRRLGFGAPARP